MTSFALKITAMLTMLCDHMGLGLVDNNIYMRCIGRLAFIIYAFLMAEAFYQLRNKPDRIKFHIIKLLLLTVISEMPYDILFLGKWRSTTSQNVMFTLFVGFGALCIAEFFVEKNNKTVEKKEVISRQKNSTKMPSEIKDNKVGDLPILPLKIIIYLAAALLTYHINSDYKFSGVMLIVMFYYYLNKMDGKRFAERLVSLLALIVIYWIINMLVRVNFGTSGDIVETFADYLPWFGGVLASTLPLAAYNRKQGYRSKNFDIIYSIFYPLHLMVLAAVV